MSSANLNKKTEKYNSIKTRQAYEYIRSRILDGTYGPGDRIVIDRIAAELSISISPVREVIRQLEADGFVQMIPYTGAIIKLMDFKEFEDTLWVMYYLDGGATALATERIASIDLSELEQINQKMKEALYKREYSKMGELDRSFHFKIYSCCGNPFLIDRLQQVWQRILRIRSAYFALVPSVAKHSVIDHDKMIQMFRENASGKKIEDFSRRHKAKGIKALKRRGTGKKLNKINANISTAKTD